MDQSINILIYLLNYLSQKEISLDKITIQKGIFFLKEMGLPIKFRFEPYRYGPFSVDLAMVLDDMVFWDELDQKGSRYYIKSKKLTYDLPGKIKEKINIKLKCLDKILGNKFDFNTLELASTILFVIRTLEANNEIIKMQSVINEVKEWKGSKFSEDEIKSIYNRIIELAQRENCLTIEALKNQYTASYSGNNPLR